MQRNHIEESKEERQRRSEQRAKMIADLEASGTVPGISIGERAPGFALANQRGEVVSLVERLAVGPVVLVFYRGSWCPICDTHIRALQRALPEITELGASLIAVSPQRTEYGAEFSDELELGFDLLCDVQQAAMAAYRVQFRLPDELAAHSAELGHAIDGQNADGSLNLPVPATFVIDRDGIVRARHVDPNYRNRMQPDAILAALSSLEADRVAPLG